MSTFEEEIIDIAALLATQGRTLVAVDVPELLPFPAPTRGCRVMQKLVLMGPTGTIEIRPSPVLFGKQMHFEVD